MKNRPEEASEIPYPSNPDQLDAENNYLRKIFKPIQVPGTLSLYSATASFTISGSSDAFDYVRRVGDINTPLAIEYSSKFGNEYQQLQEKQQRSNQARELIGKLNNPNTLERFDRAFEAFMAYKGKTGEPTAAAMEMRTLLDGIQGDLFSKAKKWPKENMTWDTMATRLAIGGGSGPSHVRLIDKKGLRTSLITRLTNVGKDREGGSVTNLENIWTDLLDHIVAVLGLVNL